MPIDDEKFMELAETWRESDRVDLSNIEVGDRVMFGWSPYGWSEERLPVCGYTWVTITEIDPWVKNDPRYGDVVMEEDSGITLRWHVDNGYVTGPSGGMEGVPPRTDIGRVSGGFRK